MKKKMLFVIAIMVVFTLFVPNVMAAEIVTNEEQFVTAIEEGKSVEIRKNLNIELTKDITISQKVTIGVSSGQENSVTIDLKGHTIKLDGSNAQLYVQTKGKLIVEDSVGNGLITTAGCTNSASTAIYIKGNCEINGGTLEHTIIGKYMVHNQGTFTMNNGTIKNNYNIEGVPSGSGQVVHNQGTFTMNNGTITNTWEKSGDTVYNNKGTFIMNGGKIVNKAAGNPGYKAAINGHTVIMTGGEIEAEGTGIYATGSSVEITGGTINAGWYGILTRYATINPAEGKQVNISAGQAAIMAHSAPSTGIGNKIYGGNFVAPMLVKGYSLDENAKNIEVYGGTYSIDVSDQLVDGKYLEKVGEVYEVKEYTKTPDITPIDPEEEVEDTTVGVTDNEETGDILIDSLDEFVNNDATEEQQDNIKNNNVVVVVEVTSKDADDLDEEVIEKIEDAAKDLVIADYFDIKILINDDEDNTLGVISKLTKEIELMILLPEELVNTDKNVERKYYVIREHNGDIDIIEDVKLSEDGKSLIFESSEFSTYAVAYEDITVELPPETGDINLVALVGTILVSMAGLVILLRKGFAKSN